MADITGTLIIRYCYAGTKSEGNQAFLLSDDLKVYHLGRRGHYAIDDGYFSPFDRQDVTVVGDVIDEKYISVESIATIPTNDKDQQHEEDMPKL